LIGTFCDSLPTWAKEILLIFTKTVSDFGMFFGRSWGGNNKVFKAESTSVLNTREWVAEIGSADNSKKHSAILLTTFLMRLYSRKRIVF
jgi:hypothetical protein